MQAAQPPPEPDDPWPRAEPGPGRLRGWLAEDPFAHGAAAGLPLLYAAGELSYYMGVTPDWGVAGTLAAAAAAAGAAFWQADRPAPPWEPRRELIGPAEAVVATAAAGAWVTAAAQVGVTARPWWWPTLVFAGGCAAGYRYWLRPHAAVQAFRARREDTRTYAERKAFWDGLCARVDELRGCHMLDHISTLVGEQVLLDTRGTGKLASGINTRVAAERIGELWPALTGLQLPRGRIEAWTDSVYGRIWVTVRTKNPWRHLVTHPLLDPDSIARQHFRREETARRPLVVGVDPESGDSLDLPVWVKDQGGQVIMVVGTKGAGKTTAMNVITERLTACRDIRVIQVNLGKCRESRAWAPACPANALGRWELGRARVLLQWVANEIDARSGKGDEAVVVPSAVQPHLVVIIDEVNQAAKDPECKRLMLYIASQCRSEGVTMIFAGQRATAAWIGGADLRNLVNIVMVGRFARPEEIDRAVGPHLDLPDLAEYGQGKAGVFMIVKLVDGDYDRGRVLFLRDPPDCARIAAGRSWLAEWIPDGTPDQDWLWRVGTGPDPVGMEDYLGPPPAGGDDEQTAPDPGQSGPRRLHQVAGEVADLASARQARQARDARLVPAELAAAVDGAARCPWAQDPTSGGCRSRPSGP